MINRLEEMSGYGNDTAGCRRVRLLQYFGEQFDRSQCKNPVDHKTEFCDNCANQSHVENKDMTQEAKDLVGMVRYLADEQSVNLPKGELTLLLRGSKAKSLKTRFPTLETFPGWGSRA